MRGPVPVHGCSARPPRLLGSPLRALVIGQRRHVFMPPSSAHVPAGEPQRTAERTERVVAPPFFWFVGVDMLMRPFWHQSDSPKADVDYLVAAPKFVRFIPRVNFLDPTRKTGWRVQAEVFSKTEPNNPIRRVLAPCIFNQHKLTPLPPPLCVIIIHKSE